MSVRGRSRDGFIGFLCHRAAETRGGNSASLAAAIPWLFNYSRDSPELIVWTYRPVLRCPTRDTYEQRVILSLASHLSSSFVTYAIAESYYYFPFVDVVCWASNFRFIQVCNFKNFHMPSLEFSQIPSFRFFQALSFRFWQVSSFKLYQAPNLRFS